MPYMPPNFEMCPVCTKAVYPAEMKFVAGSKFHTGCFKCSDCNKFLESTSVCENAGKLFCKQCYSKGYSGAAAVYNDGTTTAKYTEGGPLQGPVVENGCPRCGKKVYDAEKKVGAGKEWHKGCFSCKTCHKTLDSTSLATNQGEIYCKNCYAKSFAPRGKV